MQAFSEARRGRSCQVRPVVEKAENVEKFPEFESVSFGGRLLLMALPCHSGGPLPSLPPAPPPGHRLLFGYAFAACVF